MSEWKEYKVSELCQLIGGGTPKTTIAEYWGGDIPWLSVTDFNTGKKYCFDADKKITEKGLKESSTKILTKGQIIISARGTVGVISMLGRDMAFNQSNYGIDAKKELTSNDYLYYLLKDNVPQFISNSYGAVFDTITKETFQQIKVLLPPLSEQIQIASILSSLDDKIDLLHRQNKTLEQLAEILFRQWFVEEAEESWEVGKLGDLINVKYGKDHKKLNAGTIPAFGSGGLMRKVERSLYDFESVLIPRKGTLNNVIYIDEPFWTVDTMFYTEMKRPNIAKFIYHFIKEQNLASMNVGSAVPSMTTEILNNMIMNIPSDTFFKKFEDGVSSLYKKMKTNNDQIRTLTHLRDTLLPKLMSGEVRVNN